MVDFQRLRYEPENENEPFEEKVVEVRYDPCRSADIALVAGGKRKRWIIASENMKAGDVVKTSGVISRMAVSAKEGDAYPLGALPVGTLVHNVEIEAGKGGHFEKLPNEGNKAMEALLLPVHSVLEGDTPGRWRLISDLTTIVNTKERVPERALIRESS
ncbi:RM02 protein, partial [Polypterus senegalus]